MATETTQTHTPNTPALAIDDSGPAYWNKDGGMHITVTTLCGASASALRATDKYDWCVFDSQGEQSVLAYTHTREYIITHLKHLIRRGLLASLDQLEAAE
jgi:hypothetical protein